MKKKKNGKFLEPFFVISEVTLKKKLVSSLEFYPEQIKLRPLIPIHGEQFYRMTLLCLRMAIVSGFGPHGAEIPNVADALYTLLLPRPDAGDVWCAVSVRCAVSVANYG